MTSIRASIVTIGTEVSSGQIVNTNASWLADQLVNLKIEVVWHLTVPDEKSEIFAALDFASQRSDLLFVTGGLGPTSDDITRDEIARWTGDSLKYDEDSWKKIVARFEQMGIPAPESNKQQCFFPSRAHMIENPRGTANAFTISHKKVQLWCLPGPPDEIHGIWKNSLAADLQLLSKHVDGQTLLRWQCLGLSESALGEMVEKIIKGSTLTSGYRPHVPYIEIKIWCKESELPQNQKYLDELDTALSPWLVARDDEDCLDYLLVKLQEFASVTVEDFGSFGAFADRLGLGVSRSKDPVKEIFYHTRFPTASELTRPEPTPHSLYLGISPVDEQGRWTIVWRTQDEHREQRLQLPFKRDQGRFARERRFICEMSLASWARPRKGELLA